MFTGSGSVLMVGLCITLGSTRGLWLVTMSQSWPLIGWWGCGDGLGNIPGPDKCVIPPAYRLFNTSGNYFSSFNNNERAEHQSLSKYAKQGDIICIALRSDQSMAGWLGAELNQGVPCHYKLAFEQFETRLYWWKGVRENMRHALARNSDLWFDSQSLLVTGSQTRFLLVHNPPTLPQ